MELMLYLRKEDTNDLYIYNDCLVNTPNEAINISFPEKIRRFNNSVSFLYYSFNLMQIRNDEGKAIHEQCLDKNTQNDIYFRTIVRNVAMELFIYREKINNILCNIFFIKHQTDFNKSLKELYKLSEFFPKLKKTLEIMKGLSTNESYKFLNNVRNNEIHNMSVIDSFDWELTKNGPKPLKYRITAKELYEHIMQLIFVYKRIRDSIQDILDDSIVKIYSVRNKIEEVPFYINSNESFD